MSSNFYRVKFRFHRSLQLDRGLRGVEFGDVVVWRVARGDVIEGCYSLVLSFTHRIQSYGRLMLTFGGILMVNSCYHIWRTWILWASNLVHWMSFATVWCSIAGYCRIARMENGHPVKRWGLSRGTNAESSPSVLISDLWSGTNHLPRLVFDSGFHKVWVSLKPARSLCYSQKTHGTQVSTSTNSWSSISMQVCVMCSCWIKRIVVKPA